MNVSIYSLIDQAVYQAYDGSYDEAVANFRKIHVLLTLAAEKAKTDEEKASCYAQALKFKYLEELMQKKIEFIEHNQDKAPPGPKFGYSNNAKFVKRFAQAYLLIQYGHRCYQEDDEEGQYEYFSDALFELRELMYMASSAKQKEQIEKLINTITDAMPGLDVEADLEKKRQSLTSDEFPQPIIDKPYCVHSDDSERPALFETVHSTVTFYDVKGLDSAKQALSEAAILPRRFPQLFKNIETWKSILLYGVPGTGKTFLAKALAGELHSAFLAVSPSDIFSKMQGDSERAVRNLFEYARREAPAVIFIDEIDAILSRRSSDDNESSYRVKTEFLTQIQGVGSNNTDVLLIGATNYPEMLDPAVLRRFERRIQVPMPEFSARSEIIRAELSEIVNTVTDAQIADLYDKTDGYTASDIMTAIKQAIMQPIRDLQAATHFHECSDGFFEVCSAKTPGAIQTTLMQFPKPELLRVPPVTIYHITDSLRLIKKTVSYQDIDRIAMFTAYFGG